MGSQKQLILNAAIVVAILSSATTRGTTRPPITCHVAVFQNTQSASLVCRYNKDLRARGENYDITFCPQNSRCLDAISCNWDGRGPTLYCVTTPDFQGATCTLSGEQTGDLVCQLPNVRPHHSGSYTCHLVPPDGRVQQSCAVVVPSEDKKDEERSESAHVWALTAIVIVLGIVVIAAFIVFVVRITRKKKKREESSRSEDKIKTSDRTDQRASASSVRTDTSRRQNSPVLPGSASKYIVIADKEEVKRMLADVNRSVRSDQGLPQSQHEMHSGACLSECPTLLKTKKSVKTKSQEDADYSDIEQNEASTSRIGHSSFE